jgi:hypothetical protein
MAWTKTVFVRRDAPASRKHLLQSLLDEQNKGVGHFFVDSGPLASKPVT